jgi:hypothetical protein
VSLISSEVAGSVTAGVCAADGIGTGVGVIAAADAEGVGIIADGEMAGVIEAVGCWLPEQDVRISAKSSRQAIVSFLST